jgi:hypothetical protein
MLFVIPVLAAIAAFLSYRFFEDWTSRSWLPAGLRALGWGFLALLLVNASCPAAPAVSRPLVLLDGSLSMQASGGKFAEALAAGRALGEIRLLGVPPSDTIPVGGRSRFASAVGAAEASGRPVILLTDGEVEDGEEILSAAAIPEIRLFRRDARADIALTRVDGTTRLTAGDTLRLALEITAAGSGMVGRRLSLEANEGSKTWLRGVAVVDSGGRARARLEGPVPVVPPGVHVLRIRVTDARDPEPRTDNRLWVVHLVPTPGVVLLASPPSWESRFLISTLRDVAAVPVRGYLETEPGSWRRAGDLQPDSSNEVAEAARKADLLVTVGAVGEMTRGTRARARWSWPGGATLSGDWYVSAGGPSPVNGALTGLPVDSFPPGTAISELTAAAGDWIGMTAQLGRRGAVRPVLIGRDSAGVRRVTTGIEGLWRWAFRGGSSEQGYRALIAGTASWLLGATDSTTGKAQLDREVVANGIPASFRWSGSGNPVPLPIEWVGDSSTRRDTLVFDGKGRSETLLPPGSWRYRLEGGGAGTLAVEEYSDEFLPRPVTLADRKSAVSGSRIRKPVRGWIWLFGAAVLAFAGEWTARRRLGLR